LLYEVGRQEACFLPALSRREERRSGCGESRLGGRTPLRQSVGTLPRAVGLRLLPVRDRVAALGVLCVGGMCDILNHQPGSPESMNRLLLRQAPRLCSCSQSIPPAQLAHSRQTTVYPPASDHDWGPHGPCRLPHARSAGNEDTKALSLSAGRGCRCDPIGILCLDHSGAGSSAEPGRNVGASIYPCLCPVCGGSPYFDRRILHPC
jgi:hypothetical protein